MLLAKSVQKLLPECIGNALRESKFPKFSGGACPQTPLGWLWVYAHSLTVVTVKGLSPPLCYLFSALVHGILVAMEAFDLIVTAMHTCQHPGVNFKQRPYVLYITCTSCDNYMPIINARRACARGLR